MLWVRCNCCLNRGCALLHSCQGYTLPPLLQCVVEQDTSNKLQTYSCTAGSLHLVHGPEEPQKTTGLVFCAGTWEQEIRANRRGYCADLPSIYVSWKKKNPLLKKPQPLLNKMLWEHRVVWFLAETHLDSFTLGTNALGSYKWTSGEWEKCSQWRSFRLISHLEPRLSDWKAHFPV